MIGAREARAAARAALRAARAEALPPVSAWEDLSVADPVAVSNLSGAPSYWSVPLVCMGHVVGFVRVLPSGAVGAIGMFCQRPDAPHTCPLPPIGQSAQEVAEVVREAGLLGAGETLGDVRLVHDGPPGREAWLAETHQDGLPRRWIFVTPAGHYDRPAGTVAERDPPMD
jgi:hypothetical protein